MRVAQARLPLWQRAVGEPGERPRPRRQLQRHAVAGPQEQRKFVPAGYAIPRRRAARPDQGQRPDDQVPAVLEGAGEGCLRSGRAVRDDATRTLAGDS